MIVATQNQGEDIITLARVINPQQFPVVPADVASIACTVWDLSVPSATPVVTLTRDVAAIIQPSLLTDYGWLQDDIGYNFRDRVGSNEITPTSGFVGGHTYRIEYKLTANLGQYWNVLFVNKVVTILPQLS